MRGSRLPSPPSRTTHESKSMTAQATLVQDLPLQQFVSRNLSIGVFRQIWAPGTHIQHACPTNVMCSPNIKREQRPGTALDSKGKDGHARVGECRHNSEATAPEQVCTHRQKHVRDTSNAERSLSLFCCRCRVDSISQQIRRSSDANGSLYRIALLTHTPNKKAQMRRARGFYESED